MVQLFQYDEGKNMIADGLQSDGEKGEKVRVSHCPDYVLSGHEKEKEKHPFARKSVSLSASELSFRAFRHERETEHSNIHPGIEKGDSITAIDVIPGLTDSVHTQARLSDSHSNSHTNIRRHASHLKEGTQEKKRSDSLIPGSPGRSMATDVNPSGGSMTRNTRSSDGEFAVPAP